ELAAGKVAAAPHFKIERVNHNHELKGDEFTITDEIMAAYRQFMDDFISKNPETNLTKAFVEEQLPFARQKMREELLLAAYGSELAQRGTIDQDPQLQRAIQELPNAAQLAEKARR